MEIILDVGELTIGDVEDIEEICGRPFDELDFDKPSAKLVKAVVYILNRRTNPGFTLDDAREVKLSEVKVKRTEDRPTEAGGS